MRTRGNRGAATKPAVIVEIGNDWLKIAQTEPVHGGIQISRLHLEKFDSFGRTLSQSVANAFEKHGFARIPVIACLPRQLVNIRMMELPSTDPDEIASMADIQVTKQTPYSRDEIVFDYKIVKGDRAGYTKVLLAIVQDVLVRDRFHVLEDAGLEVERMSVTTEGLLNWYNSAIMSDGAGVGTAVLVDVDSFYSDFMVVSDGALVATRSILMGANQLLNGGQDVHGKFGVEVKRCLEACQSELPSLNVSKMFLSGAGPNVKDLNNTLKNAVSLPVMSRDYMQSVKKMPKDASYTDPSYLAVSLTGMVGTGLATSNLEFNLTPDSVRMRKGLEENARSLTVLGMLVMTALISFSAYGTSKLYLKKGQLARLQAGFTTTGMQAREIAAKQEVFNRIEERRDPTFSMVNVLAEVHARTPVDVTLDSLDLNLQADRDQVHMAGIAGTSKDVGALMKNLEQSHLFREAKEEGARVKDRESERYSFKMVCSLEKSR